MSVHEELEEHAEHAREPFDKRVAASMAIIAALLALVSVLGHILTTEELLHQQKASDQWAYSQAKDIRHYMARVARDVLGTNKGSAELVAKYEGDDKRYKSDTASIQEKAKEFEKESDRAGKKAFRMHIGEVFLEVAIVLSSLAILSKRSFIWLVGIISAATGTLAAATAFFL
jgi:uncharacterized Tic20 family protein